MQVRIKLGVATLLFGFLALAATARADQSVAEFYAGKRLTLFVGTAPGGSYHVYAQNFARHFRNHIPGKPTVVIQNMPGAGSVVLANYLYSVAPKDGTAIGTIQQSIPIMQLLLYEEARYDVDRFAWIGDQVVSNSVGAFWHGQKARTIQDAIDREVVLAAEGGFTTSNLVPLVMNEVLKTRFRLIKGIPGGGGMNLAMERGEVDGRGAVAYAGWLAEKPDWVAQKKLFFFVQAGAEPDPELTGVPLLTSFARNDSDRALLELVSLVPLLGRPLVAPPDLPPSRLAALRAAFDATVRDPEFLADAQRRNMRITPRTGDDIAKSIHQMMSVAPEVVARLRSIMKD